MTHENAKFLHETCLLAIQHEAETTKKVLRAVPAGKGDYRPHPQSRSALVLAWHLAASEIWFLEGIARADFSSPETPVPSDVKSGADVSAWYEKKFAPACEKLSKLTAEQLAKPTNFMGVFDFPLATYLDFTIRHSVHHRGQLTAYLRPMGAKVPSIYGGSADEPFEAATSA